MITSTVTVGSRIYVVRSLTDDVFDTLLNERGISDTSSIKSFIDYDDQLIAVRDRLQYDHKRELILHEILHACLEDTGTQEHHEKLVSLLAPRLVQLVDDLPVIISSVLKLS